jgi:hypothetical protein
LLQRFLEPGDPAILDLSAQIFRLDRIERHRKLNDLLKKLCNLSA